MGLHCEIACIQPLHQPKKKLISPYRLNAFGCFDAKVGKSGKSKERDGNECGEHYRSCGEAREREREEYTGNVESVNDRETREDGKIEAWPFRQASEIKILPTRLDGPIPFLVVMRNHVAFEISFETRRSFKVHKAIYYSFAFPLKFASIVLFVILGGGI